MFGGRHVAVDFPLFHDCFVDGNQPVARDFIEPDNSFADLECVILKGDFANSTGRLIENELSFSS